MPAQSPVRKIFLRAVFGFYSRKAREQGLEGGREHLQSRASRRQVGRGERLDALDIVRCPGDGSSATACSETPFHRATRITDGEVAKLLFAIRSRVLRLFRRRGLMGEEGEIETRGAGALKWVILTGSGPGEAPGLSPGMPDWLWRRLGWGPRPSSDTSSIC